MQVQKPDYQNSILNLVNSILHNYGAPHRYTTLPEADEILKKDYRHVVLLVLDGMGVSVLERFLPEESFLRSHFQKEISSVFPPTTVAATTTLESGLAPAEHGWLGWSMYFPEIQDKVNVFLNTTGSGGVIEGELLADRMMPYEKLGSRIMHACETKAYEVSPFGDYHIDTFEELLSGVRTLCRRDEKNYLYVYWPEPDHVMHEGGCTCREAREWLKKIDRELEKLSEELSDTLLLVTADHGHIDGRNVSMENYPELRECLKCLPAVEPRALSFHLKEGMEEQFLESFKKHFGKEFLLFSREEITESQLFGEGAYHPRFQEAIGDYFAVAVGALNLFDTNEEKENIIGVHAGMTKEEMTVPLIVVEKPKK